MTVWPLFHESLDLLSVIARRVKAASMHAGTTTMMTWRLLIALLVLACYVKTVRSQSHRFRREANEQRRRSDRWIKRYLQDGSFSADDTDCFCDNDGKPPPSLQQEDSGIVLGFAGGSDTAGESYNWTHVNTVAWASPELTCRAHCHGARALAASPSFDLTPDLNITKWVQNTIIMIQKRHYDGLVFDYELPMSRQEAKLYVKLISATRQACVQHGFQVITCVAWSPDGIDGRNYPAVALAAASDYLYVMDYDTQSQIISGPCIASANAPFAGMVRGIQRYLQLGIHAKKLILGVPWYGYRYPCLPGTKSNAQFCRIQQVPFRGVNCSDAAGVEIAYASILQVYNNMTTRKVHETGGIRRDDYMDAAYMNHVIENGTVYQFWFDDAKSMRDKFAWAKSMSLGGVGPFVFDDLDPVAFPKESREMWSAFDAFREGEGPILLHEAQ